MVHNRAQRRLIERRRAAVTAATTATALATGLSVGVPSAGAAACSATATEVSTGVFEVRFTSTTACDWTIPAGMTQLEALLVGSGGGAVWAYAGGGGEVKIVDLSSATGTLNITVGATSSYGGSGVWGTPPSRTNADTVVVAGSSTHTAVGGYAGAADDPSCGGKSGNNNAGLCLGVAANDGGGGAGGATAVGGDGGDGVIVDSLVGPSSLFDGVTDCYGGGGASAEITMSSYPTLTGYLPKTPGCGGGKVTTTASLPVDYTTVTFANEIDANTGGGAGARDSNYDGSDGVVVIRYRVTEDSTPPDDSTPPIEDLGETGVNSAALAALGAALLASGAAIAAADRRRAL